MSTCHRRTHCGSPFSASATPPVDWAPVFSLDGVQMVAGPEAVADGVPEDVAIVELGDADVPDMLELANMTHPGPSGAAPLSSAPTSASGGTTR